jgi:dihydrofolate synthase/folylpolyglutamate synthase
VSELDSILHRLEEFGVRLGLDTTRRLLAALGNPEKGVRATLVAGTNGKGSTAAMLSNMGVAAGYRTGLYTSPHLESVEERIRVDGRAIGTDDLVRTVREVVDTAEARLGYLPTYFEALTASAFLWFARQSMDLAVLEVGLGGRLDATNVCEPAVSLITEIGMEHQKYLGTTLAAIGREKAGILRAAKPAFAWVERTEAREAIGTVAEEIGAHLTWAPAHIRVEKREDLGWKGQRVTLETPTREYEINLPLSGEHQVANLALAVLAAEELAKQGLNRLGEEAIVCGAGGTCWPGRMEWVELSSGPVLLDVAHNPDGAETLRRSLDEIAGDCTLLFGALADKEVGRVLPILGARAKTVVLTSPDSPRAMDPHELASLVEPSKTVVMPDRHAALTAAIEADAEFVVVCGSVYLVGDVRIDLRQRFGVPPPATQGLPTP